MINKMNTFPHLTVWCEKYYENKGIKVHPSNVPVDVVLDEFMGQLESIRSFCTNLVRIYDSANERITELEEIIGNEAPKKSSKGKK